MNGSSDAPWLAFRAGALLFVRNSSGELVLPESSSPPVRPAAGASVFDVSSGDGRIFRAYCADQDAPVPEGAGFVPLRTAYGTLLDASAYAAAGKGAETVYWDTTNKFCGVCGGRLKTESRILKRCVSCGRVVFPSIVPAVIVRVDRGDSILMVRARNFKGPWYGLVAGFVEYGETLEDCVVRELFEETGLEVRNIRYFASQPWPYPCGIMLGFTAEYLRGELKIQEEELLCADFFRRDSMPELPQKLSLARRLIDDWLNSST